MAPEDRRPSGGVALEVGQGEGDTREDGSRTSFTDVRARLAVTEPRQQIALLWGLSRVSWHGARTPLWYGAGVGPGVERTRDNGFLEAVAQVRIGSGFVLDESRAPWHSPVENIWEPPRGRQEPRHEMRTRRVLTLGVSADVDARFTRSPLFMMALMIGITSFDEIVQVPDLGLPLLRRPAK
jgi:hypothetical protein